MNDDLIRRQAANDAFEGELYSLSLFEKIQNLPSVQPETHEERTETHACDLIDREAAIDAIYHHLPSVSRTRARTMLHEVPSAQTDVPDINDGDIISRQAAIDALNKTSGIRGDALKALYELPPVTPQPKSEWQHAHEILKAHSDGANEVLDKIRAEIERRKLNSGGEPNRELAFNVCLQIIDKHMAKEGKK